MNEGTECGESFSYSVFSSSTFLECSSSLEFSHLLEYSILGEAECVNETGDQEGKVSWVGSVTIGPESTGATFLWDTKGFGLGFWLVKSSLHGVL